MPNETRDTRVIILMKADSKKNLNFLLQADQSIGEHEQFNRKDQGLKAYAALGNYDGLFTYALNEKHPDIPDESNDARIVHSRLTEAGAIKTSNFLLRSTQREKKSLEREIHFTHNFYPLFITKMDDQDAQAFWDADDDNAYPFFFITSIYGMRSNMQESEDKEAGKRRSDFCVSGEAMKKYSMFWREGIEKLLYKAEEEKYIEKGEIKALVYWSLHISDFVIVWKANGRGSNGYMEAIKRIRNEFLDMVYRDQIYSEKFHDIIWEYRVDLIQRANDPDRNHYTWI